jgi:hypothetical protein
MLNFNKILKTSALATAMFVLPFSHSMAALSELGAGTAASETAAFDNTAATTVSSFAYVLTVLGITEADQMSFGAFTPGAGGSINTAGEVTGGVIAIANVANIDNAQLASIDMTGDIGEDFSLTINALSAAVTLTHTDATTTMALALDNVTAARALAFDDSGDKNQTIGGTLTVSSDQKAGLYSGSYAISISYID